MEISNPRFIELDGDSIFVYTNKDKTVYQNEVNGKTFTHAPNSIKDHDCPCKSGSIKCTKYTGAVNPGLFHSVSSNNQPRMLLNKYLIVKFDHDGCMRIIDKNFDVVFKLSGMEYVAITDWKSLDHPITTVYDKNFKVIAELPGALVAQYKKIFFVGDRFFDLETKTDHYTVTLKRICKNEVRAVLKPNMQNSTITSYRIEYELHPIVFNESECVVCTTELKERWCVVPCGHINTCKSCLDKMSVNNNLCGICRTVTTGMLKIHD
jgi:hypothetical protein